MTTKTPSPEKKPWRVANWAPAAGISLSAFYRLPPDCMPRLVRIGQRIIILEEPSAWLERMSARGGVPTSEGVSHG